MDNPRFAGHLIWPSQNQNGVIKKCIVFWLGQISHLKTCGFQTFPFKKRYGFWMALIPASVTVMMMVMVMTFSPAAYAQEEGSASNSAQVQDISVSEEGNVSLDFRDADIQNVLRILSYKSGVNIVAGPEVTGLVTIKLKDVPWEKALNVILETYGYAFERKDNIIAVTTVENLKKRREDALLLSEQEPLVTKTFVLNYAKATDVMTSIEKMKTDRGSINFDERTNSLIVRDIPDNVELIGQVIEKLDLTTPQILIEAKIVETTLNNTENLGIDWVTKATASGPTQPVGWPFTNSSEADDPEFSFGTLDFQQLQAVFELLRTRTDTNILSNPRIVTLDNQTAIIKVGSEYPIPVYTYNEEQARMKMSGIGYKNIGITFEVTPHVNNAGFITIDLEPKITAILELVTVENTQLPHVSNEEAKTSVMIRDGETLVIAGLIKDQVTDTKKKTPFLGDIPLFGRLFQKTDKTVTKTDLLIFLTPHIITPEEQSEE